MKNPIVIILILIIFASIGFGFYSLSNNEQAKLDTFNNSNNAISNNNSKNADQNSSPESKYVFYSPNILDEKADTKRVLFFYANWCPTCRPADDSFMANVNEIPEDVTVIRVNYNDTDTDNDEKALAQKYEITYQHTFVQIDSNGNQVAKWNGGQIEELLQNLK